MSPVTHLLPRSRLPTERNTHPPKVCNYSQFASALAKRELNRNAAAQACLESSAEFAA